MYVTYFINSGTPCTIPYGVSGVSLKEAIQDFRNYLSDCKRFGNDCSNAHMEVISDKWSTSRLYEVGKRGGIVEVIL